MRKGQCMSVVLRRNLKLKMGNSDMIERLRILNIGRTHTVEVRTKIGLAEVENQKALGHSYTPTLKAIESQRIAILGEKNPNWRGGKSNEPWPLAFADLKLKEQIRSRDNYQCQLCGVLQSECTRSLDIHHIDYVKENLSYQNLISLCWCCNTKVNYNREHWVEFFTTLLIQRGIIVDAFH